MSNKKKKKNSNYVTSKTVALHEKEEKQKQKEERKKIWATVIAALIVCAIIAGIVLAVGFGLGWFSKDSDQNFTATYHATIEIKDYGTVHIELYGNEAPQTVENFVTLANAGFYNGLTFHRIIEGFMAQGGQNASYEHEGLYGEFSANGFDNPILHERGIISMARASEYNSATTQFFIVQQKSDWLDGEYAAFGKVIDGMDVIDKICADAEPYDNNGGILPSQQPVITSISVHHAH